MVLTPSSQGAGDLPDQVFRHIVDQTGNPFVVITSEGVVRYAGASVREVLGWEPAELIDRNIVELLPPDQVAVAVEGLAEVGTINRTAAGLPLVFQVLRPDGGTNSVEVAALPIVDLDGGDVIALRLRIWEAEQHFDGFLEAMLDGEPLDVLLRALCRSIAALTDSVGAAVHHGYDGERFAATPSWGLPPGLAEDLSPALLPRDRPSVVAVDDLPASLHPRAATNGLPLCWTSPVPASRDIAPAVLSVWRRQPGQPLIGHRAALERSVRYVQLALVRTAEHQRLHHLAAHDALTGVANRAQFRDRLAEALVLGERDVAVAFCDLDKFKPVNDTFGHSAGDAVLVEVASRFRAALRSGDDLARLGGDEFTVLLRDVKDERAAQLVADRLLAAVREPFVVPSGEAVTIGLSVGIALWRPGATASSLLSEADDALYAAKRTGGGRVEVRA